MASSQVETVSTTADKAKLGLSVALVLASLVSFYLLAKQGQLAQWGALLACLVAAVVVFMSSEVGKQFLAFGRDSVREVIAPTRASNSLETTFECQTRASDG